MSNYNTILFLVTSTIFWVPHFLLTLCLVVNTVIIIGILINIYFNNIRNSFHVYSLFYLLSFGLVDMKRSLTTRVGI